jgi:hypothetical protein
MLRYLTIIIFIFLHIHTKSQFYNGLQTDFGKNRVQYKSFLWQYYRFPLYDVYFYENGNKIAKYVAIKAQQYIPDLEVKIGNTLQKRIIFLVYNNLSDFRQSNIGLVTGNDQYNVGGTTQLIDNKVFLYFEGDHSLLDKQIRSTIAQILLDQTLYGSDFKSKVTNTTLLNLPDWFYKGLISFLTEEWNSEIDNYVRDGITTNRYTKFNRLTGNDAIYAGHSIWYFISKKFGKQTIPNILYLTRISKNIETGFLYTIGLPVKYLNYEWLDFYKKQYENDEIKRTAPPEQFITKKIKPNRIVRDLKISNNGQWLCYSTNYMGRIKIFLKNLQTNKVKCIYRHGVRLEQITDYSYPIIAWHPSDKLFAFIIEKKGSIFLYTYELETEELSEKEMFQVQKILDFSFSHNGFNIVMSAVKNGYTDIFIFNNASNTYEQITQDIADDRYPQFIEQSQKILFSSNRKYENLKTDSTLKTYDIFIYNYKSKDTTLTRITNTPLANEIQPFYINKNEFIMLGNEQGLYNRYIAQYDSVISHIDTTTHYRYFTNISQLTNYSRNIIEHHIAENTKTTNLFYYKGKMFSNINELKKEKEIETVSTPFIKDIRRSYKDSIATKSKTKSPTDTFNLKILNIDTNQINIHNYIFNFQINKLKGNLTNQETNEEKTQLNFKPMIYHTSFYTNTITSQVDFGFLNNSYQTFTGGPFYYNPGLNVFFKLGTNDLFEDYKITGGVRFAGNFNSNEYLLSFENLKKRLDKQIVFHRLAINKINNIALLKTHTHEIFYILRYPFNQVSAVRFTSQYRYDRTAYMSTDIQTLKQPDEINLWLGLKGEFIYDNTITKGLNLLFGMRGKIFFETYHQTNKNFQSLYVSGIDFRHYQPIHRTFIWASRLAASNSFGKAKLIYYLGSVDNWINLSTKIPLFDPSIKIDQSQNYVYQAIATNMRGFPQNIRNGNNFIVLNNELRFPIIKYLMNRPIHSDFFENLQIIGFFDTGTAWTGKSPYSKQNAYNTEIIYQGPITIIIDKKRDPIVWGYGFGLRSRLLGYFVRADWAWGVENNMILPMIFYLSLSLDF